MIAKAVQAIKQFNMLDKGDSVVIGLSGGADSITLAHILLSIKKEYDLTLTAVHINHNIRPEGAVHDQRFVENFCAVHGIPLKVFSVDVKKIAAENSLTVEEAGRQQRYLAFESIGADKIAVAHNLNDNAETMVMRLCRGTGLKGMGGILPVRGNIIRPLIMCGRDEIEAYCAENGLDYCTDETNLETDYTRNKIRRLILPLLEQINPNTVNVLGKSAQLFRQENDFIENAAVCAYKNCADGNKLDINTLKSLEMPILYRVLRLACEDAVGLKDISLEHIGIIADLMDKPSGKSADLPKELTVFREYGSLVFSAGTQQTDIVMTEDEPILIGGKYYMISRKEGLRPVCYGIFRGGPAEAWHIRTRRNGDVFMRGDGREIKLKKVFIDKKVPVSQRDGLLLLADGGKVYWAESLKNKFKTSDHYLYVWEG